MHRGYKARAAIKGNLKEFVATASGKAAHVVLVLYGSEAFWRYGPKFAEFVGP